MSFWRCNTVFSFLVCRRNRVLCRRLCVYRPENIFYCFMCTRHILVTPRSLDFIHSRCRRDSSFFARTMRALSCFSF